MSQFHSSDQNMSEDREELGCAHYKRHCKLVAPCCSKVYNCRFCHDEAEPTHSLDRKKVEEVECLKCSARVPAEADCKQCGVVFGSAHFCRVCRLYDDVDKGQFHCEGCGICRVGGRDKYEHCNNCGLCLPKSDGHKCRSDISKTNCPVCMEDLHTSRVAAHIPPCSHLIHTTCYHDMLKSGLFACPTCGLSMQVEIVFKYDKYASISADELGRPGQRSCCHTDASGLPRSVQENPVQGLP